MTFSWSGSNTTLLLLKLTLDPDRGELGSQAGWPNTVSGRVVFFVAIVSQDLCISEGCDIFLRSNFIFTLL